MPDFRPVSCLVWPLGLLLSGGLLLGCQPSGSPPADAAWAAAPSSAEQRPIRRLLAGWLREQVRNGTLWPADSCKPWLIQGRDVAEPPLGLPADSADYGYSFADLNQDGRLDGLLHFTPTQCDGGNGSMWVQFAVLALSSPTGYQLTDSLDAELARFADTDFDAKGFYHLDSLGPNRVYATYYEFGPDDGHCCPHRHRREVFDYAARRRRR